MKKLTCEKLSAYLQSKTDNYTETEVFAYIRTMASIMGKNKPPFRLEMLYDTTQQHVIVLGNHAGLLSLRKRIHSLININRDSYADFIEHELSHGNILLFIQLDTTIPHDSPFLEAFHIAEKERLHIRGNLTGLATLAQHINRLIMSNIIDRYLLLKQGQGFTQADIELIIQLVDDDYREDSENVIKPDNYDALTTARSSMKQDASALSKDLQDVAEKAVIMLENGRPHGRIIHDKVIILNGVVIPHQKTITLDNVVEIIDKWMGCPPWLPYPNNQILYTTAVSIDDGLIHRIRILNQPETAHLHLSFEAGYWHNTPGRLMPVFYRVATFIYPI